MPRPKSWHQPYHEDYERSDKNRENDQRRVTQHRHVPLDDEHIQPRQTTVPADGACEYVATYLIDDSARHHKDDDGSKHLLASGHHPSRSPHLLTMAAGETCRLSSAGPML